MESLYKYPLSYDNGCSSETVSSVNITPEINQSDPNKDIINIKFSDNSKINNLQIN